MDWWMNTLKWVKHYSLLKCYIWLCPKEEGIYGYCGYHSIFNIVCATVETGTPSEVYSHDSFLCSSPVWLHHHLCSGVPAGSSPGSAQQHHWDSPWCLQVCHPVEETHACPSHRHRCVRSLTSLALDLLCVSHRVVLVWIWATFFNSKILWELLLNIFRPMEIDMFSYTLLLHCHMLHLPSYQPTSPYDYKHHSPTAK